ncbi:MAG: hypothetical protein JST16_04800 [Bdellovibrionales bacterium]|nr:hypothetical protein [Bdellovibrionales bacterium]
MIDDPTVLGFILHRVGLNVAEIRMLSRWEELEVNINPADFEVLRPLIEHFAVLVEERGVLEFLEWMELTLSNSVRTQRIHLPITSTAMSASADVLSAQILGGE